MRYMSELFLGCFLICAPTLAFAEAESASHKMRLGAFEEAIPNLPPDVLADGMGRDVKVKNHSNRQACLAIIEANPVKARGWYSLANGNEKTFYNISYIHAEECGQTGVNWSPAWDLRRFCLNKTLAFDYYTPENAGMCAMLGGVMADYFRIPSGTGVYEWTLTY